MKPPLQKVFQHLNRVLLGQGALRPQHQIHDKFGFANGAEQRIRQRLKAAPGRQCACARRRQGVSSLPRIPGRSWPGILRGRSSVGRAAAF